MDRKSHSYKEGICGPFGRTTINTCFGRTHVHAISITIVHTRSVKSSSIFSAMFAPSLMLVFMTLVAPLAGKICSAARAVEKSFTNPMLPGYNPDPSCIRVEDTFYCVTSTFVTFPGLPVYASKDLQNWKLVSHVLSRKEQWPAFNEIGSSQAGIQAPTLRHYNGVFYVVTTMISQKGIANLMFTATSVCSDKEWSVARKFGATSYDPDLFIDKDGQAYTHCAYETNKDDRGILQATLDVKTGATGPVQRPWNGTGGIYPEGPHVYLKDGLYYIINAEGGIGPEHMEVIARAKTIRGPYEGSPANPILTNKGTREYFQGVGHADLFQDTVGNWWGVALVKRSGADYKYYPMNRETALFAASWPKGGFPVLKQVRGRMRGPLPPANKDLKCGYSNGWISDPDEYDFEPRSAIPPHFTYYGMPDPSMYTISPEGHINTLRLTVSVDDTKLGSTTFVGRRQTDTKFSFSATVDFNPATKVDEAGLSVFLDADHRIDIGIAAGKSGRVLRLRLRNGNNTVPAPLEQPLEGKAPPQLIIRALNQTHYEFAAASPTATNQNVTKAHVLGYATSDIVSTGFTGTSYDRTLMS